MGAHAIVNRNALGQFERELAHEQYMRQLDKNIYETKIKILELEKKIESSIQKTHKIKMLNEVHQERSQYPMAIETNNHNGTARIIGYERPPQREKIEMNGVHDQFWFNKSYKRVPYNTNDRRRIFTRKKDHYIASKAQQLVIGDFTPKLYESQITKNLLSNWYARQGPVKRKFIYNIINHQIKFIRTNDVPLPPFFPYHINDQFPFYPKMIEHDWVFDRRKIGACGTTRMHFIDDPSETHEELYNRCMEWWLDSASPEYSSYEKVFLNGPPSEYFSMWAGGQKNLWNFNKKAIESTVQQRYGEDYISHPENWSILHQNRIKYGHRIVGHPLFDYKKYSEFFENPDRWIQEIGEDNYSRLGWIEAIFNNNKLIQNYMKTATPFDDPVCTTTEVALIPVKHQTQSKGNVMNDAEKMLEAKDKVIDSQQEHLEMIRKDVAQMKKEKNEAVEEAKEYKKMYDNLAKGIHWMVVNTKNKSVKEIVKKVA